LNQCQHQVKKKKAHIGDTSKHLISSILGHKCNCIYLIEKAATTKREELNNNNNNNNNNDDNNHHHKA
jgi:hypothetical protein